MKSAIIKSKNKYNILCFLETDRGRDVEILLPIIYFAESYLNSKVNFAFLRDIHLIYKNKPDVILLANTIGSELHHKIAKYAHENNIKVFALISEGNFKTDGSMNHWGYNTDKKFYQEWVCFWSERTYNYMLKQEPHEKQKYVITGATGFDRYKIYEFISKEEFLKKRNLENYKKVVTYASWAFGKIFNKPGLSVLKETFGKDSTRMIEWMKAQMNLVESILKEIIENNPDILFVLKRHPNEMQPHIKQEDKNEIYNLRHYPNVIYTVTDNIHDLINISDIFLGFETTTALETWLLKTGPTILINPDEHFVRNKIWTGSAIAHNYTELQAYIDEFYDKGIVSAFDNAEKLKIRQSLIKETIHFDDGYNHIRAGCILSKVLKNIDPNPEKHVRFNINNYIWYILVHLGKHFYSKRLFEKLPKFKKTVWIFNNLKLKELHPTKEKYYRFLDKFHKKEKIPTRIKQEEFCNKIFVKDE